MSRGVPVNAETRAEALRLFDEGIARNEIARRLGISTGVVSRICKAAGRLFDRAQTENATAARSIDLAAMRLELAQEMAATGLELLKTRHSPYLVYSFGGKENIYAEHTLPTPPVETVRSIVVTAGIAFDKATKVLEKSTEGVAGARSLLHSLADGFAVAAAQYEATATDDE
ncbi:MAG TPA: helix-turn-helix domain-containing protein [Galbitalea sp.]|jgi:hypothetical protein